MAWSNQLTYSLVSIKLSLPCPKPGSSGSGLLTLTLELLCVATSVARPDTGDGISRKGISWNTAVMSTYVRAGAWSSGSVVAVTNER
jgi:hypothetical protein